jgi:hypothetical protein
VSGVGYLAGPPVVGEGLADPPADPGVGVVVAGPQGLDHRRDPGRGRAVGDGVDHIAADPWIAIPGQLEQPRPHPVAVGPDVAGTQVPARELADPALLTRTTDYPVGGWSLLRSREPLNSTVEFVTRRQNGQMDGVIRSSMPARACLPARSSMTTCSTASTGSSATQ